MALRDELEISPLDEHFARLIARWAPESGRVAESARLVSAARASGHTCLPLLEIAEDEADAAALAHELRTSPVVGAPGSWQPLILDSGNRLYLQRYWQYEQDLATAIRERLVPPAGQAEAEWLPAALDRLLPLVVNRTKDQRAAALAALRSRFCVITGGPGTGKTRTVAVILALLQEKARQPGAEPLRIALAAPTGKAAARMSQALREALALPPLAGWFPDGTPAAVTLHRLLGLAPTSSLPRHNSAHPLAANVVIIDEASMIDLALMAKLFAATAPTARLILLGDRDQLASVEAGHVFGDIAESASTQKKSASCVQLTQNFRFARDSEIQRFSTAVNGGDVESALNLLTQSDSTDGLRGQPLPTPALLAEQLREHVEQIYRNTVRSADPAAALQALGAFRILCAVRKGPYGVEHLNRLAEGILTSAGLVQPSGKHYRGRPIMILQNEYHLGLYNGDIGILLPDAAAGGELRAFFSGGDGVVRGIHPARLPEHETVWAMTVHKSQGSEFQHVLLILPERDSPLLTRELIYTGITRARQRAELWYNPKSLTSAIGRKTERFSGLREMLR